MKRDQVALTTLLLTIAVLCGLLLPYGVSLAADLRREEVTSYTFESVQIDCSNYTIVEKLALLTSGITHETEAKATIRTKAEVGAICQDFIMELMPGSDVQLTLSDTETAPYLVFFEENSLVLWRASLYIQDLFYGYCVVDDTSGAILSIQLNPMQDDMFHALLSAGFSLDGSIEISEEAMLSALNQFGHLAMNLIAARYEVEDVALQIKSLDNTDGYYMAMFVLIFTDKQGNVAECPLYFDGSMLSFN